MSPFSSSICQEVSPGFQSVLSSSSNLNSPTPQEQSGVIVGAEEEVGTKDGGVEGSIDGVEDGEMEGREEVEGSIDGVEDGEMEGVVDGADDDVGIKDGIEVGLMVGGEDDVGLDEMDGTADGTPRLGSHGMSIFHLSKYGSQGTHTLGLSPTQIPL